MPISLLHNADLAIRIASFEGRVTLSELEALTRLQEGDPALTAADSVQIVADDVDAGELTTPQRAAYRARFNQLHRSIEVFVLRRSLWVCRQDKARAMAEHWLQGRHTRDGQSTEARLVRDLSEAGDLFTPQELALIATRGGFDLRARFDAGARQARL